MFFILILTLKRKFKLKTLLLNLVFWVLCYFFGFFDIPTTSCEGGFLTRSMVYGKTYLHSPSINSVKVQLLHEQLQHFLLNSTKEQFNFNIYKYKSLKNLIFTKSHPYTHPNIHLHINSYVEQILQIHVNIPMSHHQQPNFIKFPNVDINDYKVWQYVNNTISLYDVNEVSPVLFSDQKLRCKYVLSNFDKIVEHYKKV